MSQRVGFVLRLGALIIDNVLLLIIAFFASGLFVNLVDESSISLGLLETFGLYQISNIIPGVVIGLHLIGTIYGLMEVFGSASLGKMILGIEICKSDGTNSPKSRLALRYFTKNSVNIFAVFDLIVPLSYFQTAGMAIGLIFLLGCFLSLGESMQGLHDYAFDTAVFRR